MFRYLWTKDGEPFPWQKYEDRISQQPGRGTLVFIESREEDVGQYQCFATNEYGTAASNSVFFRQAKLESFKSTEVLIVNVTEGEPFRLFCKPPNAYPSSKIYWVYYYNNGGLKVINNSRLSVDPEGTLWFSNTTMEDQSDNFLYACAITNQYLYEYKYGTTTKLNIIPSGIQNKIEPVKQYVSPRNNTVLKENSIEIYCIYGGT